MGYIIEGRVVKDCTVILTDEGEVNAGRKSALDFVVDLGRNGQLGREGATYKGAGEVKN